MTDRPILFSGFMVRAILDGRKTQTRRVVNADFGISAQPVQEWNSPQEWFCPDGYYDSPENRVGNIIKCPYGQPGDRLVPALPMPGYDERYCIDIMGRPWSRARGWHSGNAEWRQMKVSANSRGYATITPAKDGRYKTALLHRLVCEAFYGPPTAKEQCRHLDGRRLNNDPNNLDWGTQSQNWADRKHHGSGMGEDHPASKLTKDAVVAIRSSLRYSQRELAEIYGVSQSTINDIQSGDTWQDHPNPIPPNHERWVRPVKPEVKAIRVERLQEISLTDVRAEGVDLGRSLWGIPIVKHHAVAADEFSDLWNTLNAKRGYGWDENPWVWVIEFKVVDDAG